LISIETTTEINYIKRGIYLTYHPQLHSARARYEALKKDGWRNPLSDMEWVLQSYNLETPINHNVKACCREVSDIIKQKNLDRLKREWSTNMHYGRLVLEEGKEYFYSCPQVAFP